VRHPEGQLLLTAHTAVAAGSLRSPAAYFVIAPQQNCGTICAETETAGEFESTEDNERPPKDPKLVKGKEPSWFGLPGLKSSQTIRLMKWCGSYTIEHLTKRRVALPILFA
jgi:hypothetical protein